MFPNLQPSETLPSRRWQSNKAAGLTALNKTLEVVSHASKPANIDLITHFNQPGLNPPNDPKESLHNPTVITPVDPQVTQPGNNVGLNNIAESGLAYDHMYRIMRANAALERGNYKAAEFILGRPVTAQEIEAKSITPNVRQDVRTGEAVAVASRAPYAGGPTVKTTTYQSEEGKYGDLTNEYLRLAKERGIPEAQVTATLERIGAIRPNVRNNDSNNPLAWAHAINALNDTIKNARHGTDHIQQQSGERRSFAEFKQAEAARAAGSQFDQNQPIDMQHIGPAPEVDAGQGYNVQPIRPAAYSAYNPLAFQIPLSQPATPGVNDEKLKEERETPLSTPSVARIASGYPPAYQTPPTRGTHEIYYPDQSFADLRTPEVLNTSRRSQAATSESRANTILGIASPQTMLDASIAEVARIAREIEETLAFDPEEAASRIVPDSPSEHKYDSGDEKGGGIGAYKYPRHHPYKRGRQHTEKLMKKYQVALTKHKQLASLLGLEAEGELGLQGVHLKKNAKTAIKNPKDKRIEKWRKKFQGYGLGNDAAPGRDLTVNNTSSIYGRTAPFTSVLMRQTGADAVPIGAQVYIPAGGQHQYVEPNVREWARQPGTTERLQAGFGNYPIATDPQSDHNAWHQAHRTGKHKIPYGRYFIHAGKLQYDRIFSLSHGSGIKVKGFPNRHMSQAMFETVNHVLRGESHSGNKGEGLSAEEHSYLNRVHRAAGLPMLEGGMDNITDPKKRLTELLGEVGAGNDAPQIKKELKKLSDRCLHLGYITPEHFNQLKEHF